jgi:hypothetical protein
VTNVGFLRPFAFEQQREACGRMFGKRAFALFPDLGTGKSYMILRDFLTMWLAGLVDGLLIIAPAGMYRQWIEEQLPATTNQECVVAAWPDPPPMEKTDKPRIYVVYPEAFRCKPKRLRRRQGSPRRKRRRDKIDILKGFLCSGRIGLVIDESQMIMTAGSKTTTRVKELKLFAEYRRIASGNPAPTGIHQYFSQYTWLSTKILKMKTKDEFNKTFVRRVNKRFGGPGTRPVPTIEGYKNEQEFYKRVAPYTYTVPIEACVDMPERTWLKVDVSLNAKQRQLISQIKQEFKADIAGKTVLMPMALQRLTRIQQVACGFLPVDVREDAEGDPEIELKWVGENRTAALEETLAQIKGKVIIWSRFSVCIERLTKHFGRAAVKYRGGMGHQERKDAKNRFLTDPKCLYMIAQPQSAGTGVDGLQKIARYSIYWSNSHNAQHRLQSERRTWRLGQNDHCFYLDMLAKGTFDERIRETLISRQNVSKGILADIAKWKRTATAKIEVL